MPSSGLLPDHIGPLVDRLRAGDHLPIALPDVAAVTEVLMRSLESYFKSIDLTLYKECQDLADYIDEKDLLNGPALSGEGIDQNEVDDLMDFSSQNESDSSEISNESNSDDIMDEDIQHESENGPVLDANVSTSSVDDNQTLDPDFEQAIDEEGEMDIQNLSDEMPDGIDDDNDEKTNITAWNGNKDNKKPEPPEVTKTAKASANDRIETSQDDIDHLFA